MLEGALGMCVVIEAAECRPVNLGAIGVKIAQIRLDAIAMDSNKGNCLKQWFLTFFLSRHPYN